MTITSDQVNYASWRRPTDTVRMPDFLASSPTEYEMYARRQADSEAAEATIARLVLNHLGLFPDEWIRIETLPSRLQEQAAESGPPPASGQPQYDAPRCGRPGGPAIGRIFALCSAGDAFGL